MKGALKGRAYILDNCNDDRFGGSGSATIDIGNITHIVRELGYEAEVHCNLTSEVRINPPKKMMLRIN